MFSHIIKVNQFVIDMRGHIHTHTYLIDPHESRREYEKTEKGKERHHMGNVDAQKKKGGKSKA
jgi:hypothetical protein